MADMSWQYHCLERLSVEELEKLLQLAVDPQSGQEDSEYIDAILEVMVKKEQERPTGRISDVDPAWNDFQTYYRQEGGQAFYYTGEETAPQSQNARRPRYSKRLRHMLIAAVVAALLMAAMTITAFGHDSILQRIAQWTSEQFYFIVNGAPRKQAQTEELPPVPEEYKELQEALAAQGVGQLLAFRDIPEGFELTENNFYPFDGTSIDSYTTYTREDDIILFDVHWANRPLSTKHEKDDGDVEVFIVNGIEHYFFTNSKVQNIVWCMDGTEYSLGTTLSKAELLDMLNSIYEV